MVVAKFIGITELQAYRHGRVILPTMITIPQLQHAAGAVAPLNSMCFRGILRDFFRDLSVGIG
jgi:hypothetical protein